jgi:shikimate dehydrogenase
MKYACVAGQNIAHSRSPMIHNYWINLYGIDAKYTIRDIAPDQLPLLIDDIRSDKLQGCNITVPHKETVIRLLDYIEVAARQTGSVNTIYKSNGKVVGTSTDGEGFIAHLHGNYRQFQVEGSKVVLLGAGGAARSILGAFVAGGAGSIAVVNRTPERAVEVASLAPQTAHAATMQELDTLASMAQIVINTTSLGTGGKGEFPFPMELTEPDCIFADIVYVPLKTPFLAHAEAIGRPTLDGLGMLLHQAVRGFELWFGVRPEVTDDLRALIEKDIPRHA